MSENTLVIITALKGLLLILFATLYVLGGRSNKWLRRFVGSAVFGGGIILFSLWQSCYSHWLLLYPVALSLSLCMGYGGDTTSEKFKRRLVYGTAMGATCLVVAIPNHSWLLMGIQVVVAIVVSVVFGLLNPVSAVSEENIIAIASVALVPWMLTGS